MNNCWNKLNKYFLEIKNLGFRIDISSMVDDESSLEKALIKAKDAFEDIKKIEAGEITNPDENRQVGHYWLRAPELAPSGEIKNLISQEIEKVKAFSSTVLTESKYKNAIIVGIGGSALGPQLLNDSFRDLNSKALKFYFADNTDPDGISRIISSIKGELAETLVIVVSKSGSTQETVNAYEEIKAVYQESSINITESLVAITVEGSKLDSLSKTENWKERFYIWDWVGGRTSICSAVGLLPLALLGLNIDDFLRGAKEMDEATRNEEPLQNPAALLASSWYLAGNGLGEKNMVVLPYKDRLILFSKYLQQLVMESLGKELNLKGEIVHQGLSVFGNKGSSDQHAYIQQLRGGRNDFFACFIEILKDFPKKQNKTRFEVTKNISSGDFLAGFLHGTREALSEKNRQNLLITLEELDEASLAALIALFERAVSLYASMVNVNAYNQPGVEAGKKAASKVIEIQQQIVEFINNIKSDFSVEEVSNEINTEKKEIVYRVLEQLSANNFKTEKGDMLKIFKTGKPSDSRYIVS